MIYLIICGGRYFTDYEFLKSTMDRLLANVKNKIVILSGGCDVGAHTFTRTNKRKVYGADGLGERYAEEKGYEIILFDPEKEKYGIGAYARRNKAMGLKGTHCVGFTDDRYENKGTNMMLSIAKSNNLIVRKIKYQYA